MDTKSPRAETTALLDDHIANARVLRYGDATYRLAHVGNGYSAERVASGTFYMCHVAIDGTIRLSDSERFGEFLPGGRS